MADSVVMAIFQDRLQAAFGSPTVPFVQTVNDRPDSLQDVWTSLEPVHSDVERIGLGLPSAFRETGLMSVVLHVRSGTGVDVARAYADIIRDLFHNYAVDHFWVTTVGSEFSTDPDDGNFFQLKIPVEYNFDFFKT